MNNLIRKYDDGTQCVCARDLHIELGNKQDYSSWIKRRINKYKFLEGSDFRVFTQMSENLQGGRPSKEYYVSLDMAKELCMVESTDRGRQVRQYFIEVEKQWSKGFGFDPYNERHLELVITGLLSKTQAQNDLLKKQQTVIAAQKRELESVQISENFKKEEQHKFRNSFTSTHVAHSLGIKSAHALHTWLKDQNIIYDQGTRNKVWYLRSEYVGRGLEYNHLARYDGNGKPGLKHSLRWTMKGKKFIYDLYTRYKNNTSIEMHQPLLIPTEVGA